MKRLSKLEELKVNDFEMKPKNGYFMNKSLKEMLNTNFNAKQPADS